MLFSNKYAQFWLNLNDFHAWYINCILIVFSLVLIGSADVYGFK